jgi:hypothetical protein
MKLGLIPRFAKSVSPKVKCEKYSNMQTELPETKISGITACI